MNRDDPAADDVYRMGTLVEVRQVRRQPDASLQVEVEALNRVRVGEVMQQEPCMLAVIEDVPEKPENGREATAMMRHLAELFSQYASLNNEPPGCT